jgi:hypothetical protein
LERNKEAAKRYKAQLLAAKLVPDEPGDDDDEKRQMRRRIKELESEKHERSARDRRAKIVSAIRAELTAKRVLPTAIDDGLNYADRFELTDTGDVRLNEAWGDLPAGATLTDWVSMMAQERPHWWPGSHGGSARGSSGGASGIRGPANPWSPNSFDRSAQLELERTSPKRAAELRRQAGL